ncbi:MAG: PIN domain-containing protein [Chloroflexi bacterium]|nr:PIN domain-containing protein [Chloroflexota bacterium]
MRVYLDVCAIQRPLDTYSQIRIVLEAEAVLGILALCDAGRLELVSSEALQYEVQQNSLPVRREHALAVLAKACLVATVDRSVQERARTFTEYGIRPLDALHLALAEAARADYFITCDDQFLRGIRQVEGLKLAAASPVEFIQESMT